MASIINYVMRAQPKSVNYVTVLENAIILDGNSTGFANMIIAIDSSRIGAILPHSRPDQVICRDRRCSSKGGQ